MKVRTTILTAVLLMAVLLPAPAYAALTTKDVEKELMCQCGCTMVVDVCDCETANQIRERIAGMIDEGRGKDEIVASFVSQYGEKMLAAPSREGFNLVAWIAPFAAVVVGGTGLFFLLRAWVARGKDAEAETTEISAEVKPETDDYRHRLDDALRRFKQEDAA